MGGLWIRGWLGCVGLGWSAAAIAGGCPEGQQGVDVRAPGPSETTGQDMARLLGHVLLGQGVDNRVLRLRRVTLAPGAQVAWHEHKDRSLMFVIESGAMTEYRSDCRVPIRHPAGSVVEETLGTKHWWRNEEAVPAVMVLSDITTPDAVDEVDLPGRPPGR